MNKRPLTHFWVLLVMAALVLACGRDQSGKIFEDHLTKYPEIGRKYIYKSVLRLANVKDDPDYNKLIKDVRKIIIYSPPSNDSTYQLKELRSAIRSGGYEELMDVRTANKDRINLWVNESLPKPHYIGLLESSNDEYIFEIDGQINLEYVNALDVIDQESLRALLN